MRREVEEAINGGRRGIRLEGLSIEDEELEEIVTLICKVSPDIEQLILARNRITDKGCVVLASLLAPLAMIHRLNYLNIEGNSIGEEGFTALCEGLLTINPRFSFSARGTRLFFADVAYEIEMRAVAKYHSL
eukprot:TRINITY_DN7222_c0_g2_i1.p1 TRINITY_DN7222_c0_g2~~TRINITY_DN7222_c0_g2_i1.p1  ORF type:complete len:132 (-),score=14.99 TRINITY_DN7222_c0_g2_i1:204-599(-)